MAADECRPGADARGPARLARAAGRAVVLAGPVPFVVGERVRACVHGKQQAGTVRFVGELENQAGTWVGLQLDRPEGKHDGEVGGRRYFDCPKFSGLFVRASQLVALQEQVHEQPSQAEVDETRRTFRDGEHIQLTLRGTVRFAGGVHFAAGVWLGLELDEAVGRCDGSADGHPYFACAPGRGLFLQPPRAAPGTGHAAGEAAAAGDARELQRLRAEVARLEAALAEERALRAAPAAPAATGEGLAPRAAPASAAGAEDAAAAARPPAAAGPAPPLASKPLTYKARRQQELRELEDKLSESVSFGGKAALSAEEVRIIERRGTEAQGSGEYIDFAPQRGYFACKKCGRPIYSSEAKFKSGCGWPAFDKCFAGSIVTRLEDDGTGRTEITCAGCGGHLGHIFEEAATPLFKKRSDQRHCANSMALQYVKHDPPGGTGEETALDLSGAAAATAPAARVAAAEAASGPLAASGPSVSAALAAAPSAAPAAAAAAAAAGAAGQGAPGGPAPGEAAAAAAACGISLAGLERVVSSLERSCDRLAAPAPPAEAAPPSAPLAPLAAGEPAAAIDLAGLGRLVARLECAASRRGV